MAARIATPLPAVRRVFAGGNSAPARDPFSVAGMPLGGSRRFAWWLWPHVLSLDAPAVAVAWQHWWAHVAGCRLLPVNDVILGLGVWMIYLADRLADSRGPASPSPDTARHAFSAAHPRLLRALLGVVAVVLAILTPRALPAPLFSAGLGLLAVAGSYFWLIHRQRRDRWAAIVPKEAFVGAIFAAGSVFFVVGRGGNLRPMLSADTLFFAVLCFLNCALITRWEASLEDTMEPSSLLNAFPRLVTWLGRACFALAILASCLAVLTKSVALLPVAFGAAGLGWMDHRREWLPADALRVLADLVLFLPALVFVGLALAFPQLGR